MTHRNWPLVLMYHGIVPRQRDRSNLDLNVVFQDDFERHLRALKRRFAVLHPHDFADLLASGRSFPRRSALVTVDDGFRNLVDYALPVAAAANVVLLAFVCSGHLDGGTWLWFARAQAGLLSCGLPPRQLEPRLAGMTLREIEGFLSDTHVPATDNRPAICHTLFDGADRRTLAEWVRRGTLCLGGHTVRHPNMLVEATELCHTEILENKHDLERIAGAPVTLFAYPSGGVNASIARCVLESGYLGAFSIHPPARSFPSVLRSYHIPRTGVYSTGALAFWLKCSGTDHWRWKFGLIR